MILTLCSLLLAVPVLVLATETFAALFSRDTKSPPDARPSLAVLMPAHDEAEGIGQTLASLLPQLAPADRLLVVADNCSDGTMAIAAAAGATVIERRDLIRRGKGYALDFGMRHLAADAPQIVVIADADCDFAPGALDTLARACLASGHPEQALYLMRSPSDAGIATRIAEFAWIVKNQVRPVGLRRLGLPCQLMGSGMAFPWDILRRVNLASGHLVEDLQMGLDLAHEGHAPRFCPQAQISSVFPTSQSGLASQRRRWEHGHLSVIASRALPTLLVGLRRADLGLIALGLDLLVPPLALLLLLALGCLLVDAVWAITTGRWLPLSITAGACAALGLTVVVCWAGWGHQAVTASQLARAPLYALRKIPLYLRFFKRRQTDWVRSQRNRRG